MIVCDPGTDINNPNVVRSSVGTLFTLPVIQADADETLAWCRSKGLHVLAATPEAMPLHKNYEFYSLAPAAGAERLDHSQYTGRPNSTITSPPPAVCV